MFHVRMVRMWRVIIPAFILIHNVIQTNTIVGATNDLEKIEHLLMTYSAELKELNQKYYQMETDLTKRVQLLENTVETQDIKIRHLEITGQKTKNDLEATVAKLQLQEQEISRLRIDCKEAITQNEQYKMDTLVRRNKKGRNNDTDTERFEFSNDVNTTDFETQENKSAVRSLYRIRSERLLSVTPKFEITSTSGHAFYAYMNNDLPPPSPHHIFVYDYVVTNVGNNYNKHSGMFTVPESGVYYFSATSITDGHSAIMFEIVKNSSPFAMGFANSAGIGNYHTGTIMGIIYAEAGDVVHVRSQNNHPSDNFSSQGIVKSRTFGRTSFCGWRIL